MAALTRLDAVNRILQASEEQPVSTLVNDGVNDVSFAETVLDQVTLEIQSQGFGISQETKTFNYDSDGYITVSDNYLVVDPVEADFGRKLVVRGTRLYDADNGTYVFDATVRLRVTLTQDFADLPPAVQFYIADKAARRYQMQTLGDPEKDRFLAEQELKSMVLAKQVDARSRNGSWIHNPYSNSGVSTYRHRRPYPGSLGRNI